MSTPSPEGDREVPPADRAGAPLAVREDWLARHREAPLDPAAAVVDAHHHLWERPGWPYLVDAYAADVRTGHRVLSTVFVQCRSRYRSTGDIAMRSVGETEFAAASGAMTADGRFGPTRFCEAIVAQADLLLGPAVGPVLDAHAEAGAGRLRGIRHSTAWDADSAVLNPELGTIAGMMADPRFRRGFAELASRRLSFDAWVYHPQLDEVRALARGFPDTTIVLNHVGGPLGIGRYADDRADAHRQWLRAMRDLSRCPNVVVKLGGLGMRISGHDFHRRAVPPTSTELAEAWRPHVEPTIEAFGPDRCLFESNFPVDKASCSYTTLWNAFKRLAAPYGDDERHDLLRGVAVRVYRLRSDAGAS